MWAIIDGLCSVGWRLTRSTSPLRRAPWPALCAGWEPFKNALSQSRQTRSEPQRTVSRRLRAWALLAAARSTRAGRGRRRLWSFPEPPCDSAASARPSPSVRARASCLRCRGVGAGRRGGGERERARGRVPFCPLPPVHPRPHLRPRAPGESAVLAHPAVRRAAWLHGGNKRTGSVTLCSTRPCTAPTPRAPPLRDPTGSLAAHAAPTLAVHRCRAYSSPP